MSYLNALIDARHYLAILTYERRTRVFLVREPVWTAQVLAAIQEVQIALVGYLTMRGELEMMGVRV